MLHKSIMNILGMVVNGIGWTLNPIIQKKYEVVGTITVNFLTMLDLVGLVLLYGG